MNSGQGGGGTTLGTGIQGIALNDGMIFTYVTGMNASFLASASAGGLDQNEADSEQNIQFTGLNATNGASFKVVKMSKNVAADVKIAAYSTAVQSGTQYVDGLGDDGSAVAINSVTVNGVARAFTTNADGRSPSPASTRTTSSPSRPRASTTASTSSMRAPPAGRISASARSA